MENAPRIPWLYRIAVYLLALEGVLKFIELGFNGWRKEPFDIQAFCIGVLLIHGAASLLERRRAGWFLVCVWLGVRAVLAACVLLPGYIFARVLPALMKPSASIDEFFTPPLAPAIGLLILGLVPVFCIWQWWAIGSPAVSKRLWPKAPASQAARQSFVRRNAA